MTIPHMSTADDSPHTRRSLSAAASVLREGTGERVELSSFLDEELAVLLQETGLPGPAIWMPWEEQNPGGVEAGAASVARILRRRRHLVPEALAAELEDREPEIAEEALVTDPTTAGTLVLRRSAVAVTTARRTISVSGEPRELRCYFYHQSVGVTLEEKVTAEGLHSFAVLPTAEVGERLTMLVDPQGVASSDSEMREIPAGTPPEEWGEGIAEGTRHLTQVVTASADSATARSAAFHATDAAVHVAVADAVTAAPDGSTALRIAQVGPESLQDVLDQIVGGGDTAPTDPA